MSECGKYSIVPFIIIFGIQFPRDFGEYVSSIHTLGDSAKLKVLFMHREMKKRLSRGRDSGKIGFSAVSKPPDGSLVTGL